MVQILHLWEALPRVRTWRWFRIGGGWHAYCYTCKWRGQWLGSEEDAWEDGFEHSLDK